MTPGLTYLLQINAAIAVFYICYRLFFSKDTFFSLRRATLLGCMALTVLYPLPSRFGWFSIDWPKAAVADFYAPIQLPEIMAGFSGNESNGWHELAAGIYWAVILLLAIRMLVQLATIVKLHIRCRKAKLQGTKVHLLEKENPPFSFFHWIFVHPDSLSAETLSEILTHEKAHACQFHSMDVLIAEGMCIACWFNPFAWLMKREIRKNLEYLADRQVLKTGHDWKTYQYHLLGLTCPHRAIANLYNQFNVLLLKNRIKMMNKKRTSKRGRIKYLIFLPLAAALMIACNAKKENQTTAPSDSPTVQATADTDSVFDVVEEMPQYSGGMEAMMKYFSQNIKYPANAQEAREEGRVIVKFVVRSDGSVGQVEVVKGVSPLLDKEAVRVVKAMPKWQPGRQNGTAVNTRFTLPVNFSLSPADKQ